MAGASWIPAPQTSAGSDEREAPLFSVSTPSVSSKHLTSGQSLCSEKEKAVGRDQTRPLPTSASLARNLEEEMVISSLKCRTTSEVLCTAPAQGPPPAFGHHTVHGALWQRVSLQAGVCRQQQDPRGAASWAPGHPAGDTLGVVSVLLPKDHSKGQLPRSPWPWRFLGGMRGYPS